MGRRSSKSKILYYNIPALPILKVVRIGNIKEQTLATWIHFKIVMLSERSQASQEYIYLFSLLHKIL